MAVLELFQKSVSPAFYDYSGPDSELNGIPGLILGPILFFCLRCGALTKLGCVELKTYTD